MKNLRGSSTENVNFMASIDFQTEALGLFIC